MKLIEALQIVSQRLPVDAPCWRTFLACGFSPLHLETFLMAHLRTRHPTRQIQIQTGLFGDLSGNLERLAEVAPDVGVVVIEWADLDPRLGLRSLGGWRPKDLPDILQGARDRANHLTSALLRIARQTPLAICLPTLPVPPVSFTAGKQAASFQFELVDCVNQLAISLAECSRARIMSPQRLDQISPMSDRLDVKSEFMAGFPYRTAHASYVAEILAELAFPLPSKKGLITDLDNTVWRGILGDAGPDGISWDLASGSQIHGLYQQFLMSLLEAGVLVGIASKNNPEQVAEAFANPDLILSPERLFPMEVHWGRKSESVGRILQAWNIAADSVVFIDDSPMELAEVQSVHHDMTCLCFPHADPQAVYKLLEQLRDLFGKSTISAEDAIRVESLRARAIVQQNTASEQSDRSSSNRFLEDLQAEMSVSFVKTPPDPRAFELISKTNQFNLNGRRYTEAAWDRYLKDDDTFLLLVDYRDKFGPLGKVAAIAGRQNQNKLLIETWVMSCRAFSRRIEHSSLRVLFETSQADEIAFNFEPTQKNRPIQEFLTELTSAHEQDGWRISRSAFVEKCPPLYQRVQLIS